MTRITALGALVVALVSSSCGTTTQHVMTNRVERPDVISRVMRGGTRAGCEVSTTYDEFLGIFIDCEGGRVVVGRAMGANAGTTTEEGRPLEVVCYDDMADECRAFWGRIYGEGEAECADDEVGPGCGTLNCTGSLEVHSCADIFDAPEEL